MNNHEKLDHLWCPTCCTSGVAGCLWGAWIKGKISPEDLTIFETGVRYHMYHALGLILMSVLGLYYYPEMIQLPAILLSVGILLFSGSLYILVLTGLRWMGAITPIGGVAFIAGWLLLAYRMFKV